LGFGCHTQNILQPLIDQAITEISASGKPTKKTLVELADKLVSLAWTRFTCDPYYSEDEKEQAVKLLRACGLGNLANLSPRFKEKTLAAIEAAKLEVA
jgi:hypothetical protein